MKTAVSIPDDVFEAAEELARQTHTSRSQLYATALRALLAKNAELTDQLNQIYDGEAIDHAVAAAGRRTLASSDW